MWSPALTLVTSSYGPPSSTPSSTPSTSSFCLLHSKFPFAYCGRVSCHGETMIKHVYSTQISTWRWCSIVWATLIHPGHWRRPEFTTRGHCLLSGPVLLVSLRAKSCAQEAGRKSGEVPSQDSSTWLLETLNYIKHYIEYWSQTEGGCMDVKQPMWMHEHRDTLQIDKKKRIYLFSI